MLLDWWEACRKCNFRRIASIAKKSVGGRAGGGGRLGSGIIVRYGTGRTIAIEGDSVIEQGFEGW